MATLLGGTNATWSVHHYGCRWVKGKGAGTLESHSFGSCVGLVLWSPKHLIGVVAHYSGSMGHAHATTDTLEILKQVCPVSPGIWHARIFRGSEANPNVAWGVTSSTSRLTMEGVIDGVKQNPYFPCQRRIEGQGHEGVRLTLATGLVSWERGKEGGRKRGESL